MGGGGGGVGGGGEHLLPHLPGTVPQGRWKEQSILSVTSMEPSLQASGGTC